MDGWINGEYDNKKITELNVIEEIVIEEEEKDEQLRMTFIACKIPWLKRKKSEEMMMTDSQG